MAQFTVYQNKNSSTRGQFPLLLDVQVELLEELGTRVVVPLSRAAELTRRPIERLMPIIVVDGEKYVSVTQELAATPKSYLGRRVASVAGQRDAIIAALDFLITGI